MGKVGKTSTCYKYPAGPFLGESDMIKWTLTADRHGTYYLIFGRWIGSETTADIVLRHGIFTPEEAGYLKKNGYIPLYFSESSQQYTFLPMHGYVISKYFHGEDDRCLESRMRETAPGIWTGERIGYTKGGWCK